MNACIQLRVVTSGHVTKMRPYRSIRHNQKPHAAHKLRGSMFYRNRSFADRSFTLREWGFPTFLRDLDINPITLIYELDPYSLGMYRISKIPISVLSTVIV